MSRSRRIVQARLEGVAASEANKGPDANPYEETDELHDEWLRGWEVSEEEREESGKTGGEGDEN